MAGRQSDDSLLKAIARDIHEKGDIENLGEALGFSQGDIQNFIRTNSRYHSITSDGTVGMLRKWRERVSPSSFRTDLREVLLRAKFVLIADKHLQTVEPMENVKLTEQEANVGSSKKVSQVATRPETESERKRDALEKEILPDNDGYYKQTIHRAEPTSEQLDPTKNYRMTQRDKGVAFILNNNKFGNQNQRKGSEVDVENVKHVFDEIGYQVTEAHDRTTEDITKDLYSLKQQIRKSDISAVFVFMSHGNREGICGTDGKVISVETIKEMFSGRNCPNLSGKPKIFFIQACRGDKVTPSATGKSEEPEGSTSTTGGASPLDDSGDESGEGVNDGAYTAGRSSGSPQLVEIDFGPEDGDGKPDNADMFICFATCEGYVSLRNKGNGSWFIQALCEELLTGAHLYDLSTIMEKVSGRVNKQKGFVLRGKRKVPTRQTTQTVSQGIEKKIYFLPKFPHE